MANKSSGLAKRGKHDLPTFLKKKLDTAKLEYVRGLGVRNCKYVETMKMFENLARIAEGLCSQVQCDDEFKKLEHRVVKINPLAVREIAIWHSQIRKRLRRTAFVKTGWTILLVRDLPLQIFEHIICMCAANTCFETTVTRTVKDDVVQFTDIRKVKYLFKHVGIHETLRKQISNQGSAEVIVSKVKPFQLQYNKRKEQLRVSCHFGFWNAHGIPQF